MFYGVVWRIKVRFAAVGLAWLPVVEAHHCYLFDEHTSMFALTFAGFARAMTVNGSGQFTDYVATRWYRSPELLLG